jgi:hypothetical protein
MNISELLYKRVLVAEKERSYNSKQTVEEIKILEISPSGDWVKIQNMNGNKYWKHSSDIVPIEILASIETKPNN